jgi:MFS family permease
MFGDSQSATQPRFRQKVWMAIRQWLVHSAWPGMGLFGESYILFSIGTLTPLWEAIYPECFNYTSCRPRLLYSLTYSVVAGVIIGMVVIGRCANTIGRRKGSILTAFIMSGGAWSLVLESFLWNSQESVTTLFRSTALSLFIFGVGVGGEYPLSCSSAAEASSLSETNTTTTSCRNIRWHCGTRDEKVTPLTSPTETNNFTSKRQSRGRQIQLVFAMQGVGIWFNSVTLLMLLWILGQTSIELYQSDTLVAIWRLTYVFGASILLVVLVTRFLYLKESKVWEQSRTAMGSCSDNPSSSSNVENSTTGVPDMLSNSSSTFEAQHGGGAVDDSQSSYKQPFSAYIQYKDQAYSTSLWYNYGLRLFGASMTWLLWDVSFYGNKLFQATFLLALTGGNTTLVEFALAATLNSTVALLGYFGAAAILDNRNLNLGRVKLQCIGFAVTGSLFVSCGFAYDSLPSEWLVGLYMACSFFGQLGPNATTFLIPGEIFPTEHRTYCHGICAASGKVGALVAAILFHFVQREADLFLFCGYTSFAGCLLTYFFIPETLGLELNEIDKKWQSVRKGQRFDYHGPANQPEYLSKLECWLGL